MKVGTDGVLLGVWADVSSVKNCLDIGTGTGLISLIIAQRCNAIIDAIEINKNSFDEAKENFDNSKWSHRINAFHSSFQEFYKSSSKKYELIITNPPYFKNSLKSEDIGRNLARHNDELSLDDLLSGLVKLLNPSGKFCLILPTEQLEDFKKMALEKKLFCKKQTNVRTTPTKDAKRVLLEFRLKDSPLINEELIIEQNGRHQYSDEYINLTKDFYLNM